MENCRSDYIRELLRKYEYNTIECYKHYDKFIEDTNSYNWTYSSFQAALRKYRIQMLKENTELEADYLIKLSAQKQKQQDLKNLANKINRESFRQYNTLEEAYSEYVEQLKKVDLSKFEIKPIKTAPESKTGIFTIADAHINEIIRPADTGGNEYDFNIFSKRLKKFVAEAIKHFNNENVKNVYIFFLGDLINSPRRLSERISMNSSLVTASLLATSIFLQMIVELSQHFNITASFCVGNESRINDFMDSNRILASENWDYLIFHNLRLLLENKNINFIQPENIIQSLIEIPIKEKKFGALITHGHIFKMLPTEKTIGSILQSYSMQGKKVHSIFMGHFHAASIGDFINISGSLKGGDSWTYNDCGYMTRASQNIYIINNDLSVKGIKIDLQNTNEKGYEIQKELSVFQEFINPTYNSKVIIKNLV